jgi:pimeloyl-ACP methyl ester carboxylesterase
MDFDFYVEDALLKSPSKRAAYSDRTAWLMSVMSWLAYLPFDRQAGPDEVKALAQALASERDVPTIIAAINQLLVPGQGEPARVELETKLGLVGFKLEKIFDIRDGLNVDTQAFIARVDLTAKTDAEKTDMLVLAFRGTEPKRLADLRTDLNLAMTTVKGDTDEEPRVHSGFLNAFLPVRDRINEVIRAHSDLPVFVTGHSLGGALAVVATRYIANRSEGACYTFGAPRIGNEMFFDQIYTPLYRVVNASDGVPAIPPPGWMMKGVTRALRWSRFTRWLVPHFNKFNDYRHMGDQRHLSNAQRIVDPSGLHAYPGLKLRSGPTIGDRWSSLVDGRMSWLERLRTPLAHHDISKYSEKLSYYALERRARRKRLNASPSVLAETSEPAER